MVERIAIQPQPTDNLQTKVPPGSLCMHPIVRLNTTGYFFHDQLATFVFVYLFIYFTINVHYVKLVIKSLSRY